MTDTESTSLMRIARLSIRLARRCVATYGSVKSRKDFTQPQLVTCLVLRAVLRTDYRGVCDVLKLSPPLCEAIGLDEKVPHWTTLQKFMARPGTPDVVDAMLGQLLHELGVTDLPSELAVDSTGLQSGVASEHYRTRRGTSGTARRYVKLSAAVLCGSFLPAAVVIDLGPSNDMRQMPALLEQIDERTTPTLLLADRGYDAEWVHMHCRERLGAQSVIPVRREAGKRVASRYRRELQELPKVYGRRWHAETFFSGLKRTMLATLTSRKVSTMFAEAAFKVLGYAIRR